MNHYAPKRVFIIENNEYIEITYEEYCRYEKKSPCEDRYFLPLHGMLLEVKKTDFDKFYRLQNRQRYLKASASRRGDISYNAFDTNEFNGEDFLMDENEDVAEQATFNLMLDKLRLVLDRLNENDRKLINQYFYDEIPQTELAIMYGVTQQAISKRIARICAKIKKYIEN